MKLSQSWGCTSLRPRGGILRCAECGYIIGYLHEENLESAYLLLRCHCGGSGVLRWGRKEFLPDGRAVEQDGVFSCPECRRIWLQRGVGMSGLSFRFVCQCGCSAEISHTPKREIYQELKFT